MQKPSIGRIVIVPVDPDTNSGVDEAAAIITRVWSDTTVNVRVFVDGSNEVLSRTSVTLAETRDHHAVVRPGCAWWPPRV